MKITRTTELDFVVIVGERADYGMRLIGSELRSHEQHGDIRISGLMRVTLGPRSLVRILAMPIGATIIC